MVVDGCCSLNDADDADGRQCKMPRVYDSVTGIMTAATTKKIITKRAVANAAAAASDTSFDKANHLAASSRQRHGVRDNGCFSVR